MPATMLYFQSNRHLSPLCADRTEMEQIMLTRPEVEAGETLGFLPGDLREKIHPYLHPMPFTTCPNPMKG